MDKKLNETTENKEIDKKDNVEVEKTEITVLDKKENETPENKETDNKENVKDYKKEN